MAISRLTGQDATASSATTSVAATYASTPTAGNLLIAVVAAKGTAPSTITGWTQAVEQSVSNSATILYRIATGAESTTVTASNGTATAMAIGIYEYSGAAKFLPADTSAAANSASSVTSLAIGPTATLVEADELAIAMIALGNTFSAPSWNNSFNLRASVSAANIGLLSADRIVSATTALSTTGSWTTSRAPDGAIATFKGELLRYILLESGDRLLLEDGDDALLEHSDVPAGGTDGTATPAVVALTTAAPSATLSAGASTAPAAAALVLAPQAPSLSAGASTAPAAAALVLAPQTVTASGSENATVTPDPAALSLTPQAPDATAGSSVAPAVAALTLAPQAVALSAGSSAAPAVVSLVLAPQAPSASGASNASPAPDAVALSIVYPAPTVSGGASTSPAVALLVATPLASTASGSGTAAPVVVGLVLVPQQVTAIEETIEPDPTPYEVTYELVGSASYAIPAAVSSHDLSAARTYDL